MKKILLLLSDRNLLIVFVMGISSGLPLLLIGSTLQAWFYDNKMDLHTIALFGAMALPYTFKFLWAPFFDRWVPPFLGRRRGWMAITQVGLALAIGALAFTDPMRDNLLIALIGTLIAILSASQDIAIDAYRREVLPDSSLGLGVSLAVNGYRIGMLFAGTGALDLAHFYGFRVSYLVMAVLAALGLVTTLIAHEPEIEATPPRTMREAYVEPFMEFFKRDGALWILAFILLYKLGDNMATALTVPFYQHLDYSKLDIGNTGKFFGLWATIVGGLIGGFAMLGLGIRRSLWIFGILQGVANLSFAWLAMTVPTLDPSWHLPALRLAVSVENLSAGMGTAAYTAFMAVLTNKRFTATQYALLTSLMSAPRVLFALPTGYMVEWMGWPLFFEFCTLASLPGLVLLFKIGKWAPGREVADEQPSA